MNQFDYANAMANQALAYGQHQTRALTIKEQLEARAAALQSNLEKVEEWKRELATVNRMLEAAKEPQ